MSDISASSQIAVGTPRIDDRDWSQLTLGQRIQHLEVEGYVVLPDMLDADHIARLKEQASTFETTHVDYSVHQRGRSSIQFTGGPITELIAYPPMIEFLKELCGDHVVLMSYDYSRSEPGTPRYQPTLRRPALGFPDFQRGIHLSENYPCPLLPRRPNPRSFAFPRGATVPFEFPQRGKPLPALRRTPRRNDGNMQGWCCGAIQQLCLPR